MANIKEITEKLEDGLKKLVDSDEYKKYLKTMSKFHNYSANNCMLIMSQNPSATYVMGYRSWQSIGRQVQAGSKAITIIQPAPIKECKDVEVKDADGNVSVEQKKVIIPRFKAGYVFDISDTEGEPLPTICQQLMSEVKSYDELIELISRVSPVPVVFEKMEGPQNGYYSLADNDIHIKEGLGQLQTLKTMLHEIAHSILHAKDTGLDVKANQREREVEAESVAFCVSEFIGLDTSDYSFGYIVGWSSNEELKEFQKKLEIIRKTSDDMIKRIDAELLKMRLSKQDEIVFKNGKGYLDIEKRENDFTYKLFAPDFVLIDSGIVERTNDDINKVADELMEYLDLGVANQEPIDVDTFKEKVKAAETLMVEPQNEKEKENLRRKIG